MKRSITIPDDHSKGITPVSSGISYEYDIQTKGSRYHVIIGRHQYGSYISIPDWNISSELSYLSDRFWNLERLQSCGLSDIDSKNIADALLEISKELQL